MYVSVFVVDAWLSIAHQSYSIWPLSVSPKPTCSFPLVRCQPCIYSGNVYNVKLKDHVWYKWCKVERTSH